MPAMTHDPIPTEADRDAERRATRELLELGLEMVARGLPGIPEGPSTNGSCPTKNRRSQVPSAWPIMNP